MGKDVDLDDFDLEEDLDLDFDFDVPENTVPEGRDAVMAIPKSAAAGAAKAIVGPGKRKRLILNSLPSEYTTAFDAYDEVASEGREVVREAKQQLNETKRELKRATKEAMPVLQKYLPKKFSDKISGWAKSDDMAKYEEIDPREGEIAASMDQIFSKPQPSASPDDLREQQKDAAQEKIESDLKDQINNIRDDKIHKILFGMGQDVGELVGYQNSVTTNYRRKMLEINYRQYYAMTDLVEVTKQSMDKLLPGVESIIKNTALPDYAKEEFGEITSAMMKRQIIEKLSPANFARNYVKLVGANARRSIGEFFGGVKDTISDVGGMAGMAAGMDSGDGAELSPQQQRMQMAQSAAGLLGGQLANRYATPHIQKLQERLRTAGEENEAVSSFGRRAAYYATNIPEILNTYSNDAGYEGAEKGVAGGLASMLQGILPTFNGEQVGLDEVDGESLNKVAPWTSRSHKTLNEIIPGLLSKIDQSIRSGFSGEPSELEQYDFQTRQFVSSQEISDRIRNQVGDQETREYMRGQIDELVKTLDKEEQLSEEDRLLLGKTLDEQIRKVRKFDIRDLASTETAYGSVAGKGDVSNLMDMFAMIDADKAETERLNLEMSARIKRLRDEVGAQQQSVTEMAELYGDKAVVDAGIFDATTDGQLRRASDLQDTYADFKGSNYDNQSVLRKRDSHQFIRKVVDEVGNVSAERMAAQPETQPIHAMVSVDVIRDGVKDALFNEQAETNLYTALGRLQAANVSESQRTEEVSPLIQAIHDQLVENNLTPQVDSILEILGELATNGFPTHNVEGEEGESKGNFFTRNFGRAGRFGTKVAGNAAGAAKGVFGRLNGLRKGAQEGAKKVFGGPSAVVSNIASFASRGITGAMNVGSSAAKATLGIRDIYDADGNIVLHGRLLKAGKYFDAEGNPIKSIKDIKGVIYDAEGNVVISAEDIQNKLQGFTYNVGGKWEKLTGAVGGMVGSAANTVLGIPPSIIKALQGGVEFVKKQIDAKDVYVEGEKEPRLQRRLMLQGFYISKKTGKPIRSANAIDGAVVTRDGDVIISESELADPKFKLVDINGNEFKGLFSTMVDKAKQGFGMVAGAAGAIAKMPLKLVERVKGMFGKGEEGEDGEGGGFFKGMFGGQNKTVERLDKIYNLLDERMAIPEKQAFDDVTGDGVRDNSFQDILRKRKEKKEADEAAKAAEKGEAPPEKKGDGFFSKLTGVIGGAIMSFGGKLMSLLTDGIGGLFGKLATGLKTMAMAKTVTTAATTAASAASTAGAATTAASAAGKGSLAARAGSALWTGAKFLGGTVLWGGAKAAGAAVIGTVSAPVLLGAAAVAAVGGLAYGGYKLATRQKAEMLDRLRFAQYGVQDYDREDLDDVAKLRYLEAQLLKNTAYDSNGVSTIRGVDNKKTMEIAEGFGVDFEDPEAMNKWEKWLFGRFIPVFLLWTSRARQFAPGIAFIDIGLLDKNEVANQVKILDGAKLPANHPIYQVAVGPFDDTEMLSAEEVMEVQAEVEEELKDLLADEKEASEKDSKPGFFARWFGGEEEVTANNSTGGTDDATPSEDPYQPTVVTTTTKGGGFIPGMYGNANIQADTEEISQSREADSIRQPSDLNAVDGARMRAYGLRNLAVPKVALLFNLEEHVYKDVVAAGATATYRGDIEAVMKKFLPKFGLDASNSVDKARWKAWFTGRFMPVLLRYVTELQKYVPNARPFDVTVSSSTSYLYDVVLAMLGTHTTFEGREMTIWEVTTSPFNDGTILADSASYANGNVKYLEAIRKQAEAREQSGEGNGQGFSIVGDMNAPKQEQQTVSRPTSGTAMSNAIFSGMSADEYNANATTSGGGANDTSEGFGNIPISETEDAAPDADSAYANLRLRGNNKEAVANLIKDVSKATGVDANLLLTVGMMESSLNPKAGASTSSAKGLFQFINSTWKDMLGKYANKYGIPSKASPYDPVANSLLGAEYIREGMNAMSKVTDRQLGPTDVYMAHFLGQGGAKKFMRGLDNTPDRIAALDFKAPAKANPGVFGDKGSPLTYAGMYNKLQRRARTNFSYVAQYSDQPEVQAVADAGKPEAQATSAGGGMQEISVAPPKDLASTAPKFKTTTYSGGSMAVKARFDEIEKERGIDTSPTHRDAVVTAQTANATRGEVDDLNAYVATPTSANDGASANKAAEQKVVQTAANEIKGYDDDEVERVKQARRDARLQLAQQRNSSDQKVDTVLQTVSKQNRDIAQGTAQILNSQLTEQKDMAVSLRYISKKLDMLTEGREADQLARDEQRERQRTNPQMDVPRGPISMSRNQSI